MQVGARAPRSYHSHYNPLVDLSSDDMYKNYRFTADGICQVTGLIEEDLEINDSRGRPILPQTAVLVTSKYLASNSYQQGIAETFKISQSSVSRCIALVVDKLVSKAAQFIQFPHTTAERRYVQQGFSEIAGFPSVVGCIDGTHISILRPTVDEAQYVCRKGYHSINVQAVCDHKCKLIHVSAK